MKCYNHPDKDAVAACKVCGRGLCKECADKYPVVLCDKCYAQRRANDEASVQKRKSDFETNLKRRMQRHCLAFLRGFGVVLLVILVFAIFKAGMKKIYLLPFLFFPFAWNNIDRYIPLNGCLLFIVKFFVAFNLGVLFYLKEIYDIARACFKSSLEKTRKTLLAGGFVLLNVAMLAVAIFVTLEYSNGIYKFAQIAAAKVWELINVEFYHLFIGG